MKQKNFARAKWLRVALWTLFALLVLGGFWTLAVSRANQIFADKSNLDTTTEKTLNGESDSQINILLLGMRGEDKAKPNQTSAVMLLSINNKLNSLKIISFSRDLFIPTTQGEYKKINKIYETIVENPARYGNNSIGATQDSIAKAMGIPINYTLIVDFKGFEAFVDQIGGVDIAVTNQNQFPFLSDPEFSQAVSSTNPGTLHLNGQQALIFSSWPYNALPDYNRLTRQQLFIKAVKNKMVSSEVLLNPVALRNVVASASKNIHTNLKIGEMIRAVALINKINSSDITSYELTTDNTETSKMLKRTNYDGSTISPTLGYDNFSEVQNWIVKKLSN